MEAVLVTVGRDHDMTNKRIRLPKDGLVEPAVGDGEDFQGRDDYQGRDDVQGHGLGEPDKNVKSQAAVGDGEDFQGRDDYQGRDDVQGHSFVNPAPPADFSKRGPSSGGEFVRNHEDADASD
jgi:hypothetical protein